MARGTVAAYVVLLAIAVAGLGFTLYTTLAPQAPATEAGAQLAAGGTADIARQGSIGYFTKVSDQVLERGGKPVFFFMGAQYCPYCAAERWAIVEALKGFGTWENLQPYEQVPLQGLPATYEFVGARFSSPHFHFVHKEIATKDGGPLEELDVDERALVNRYDARGGVPFLFVSGGFVQLSSGYSPQLLRGKRFADLEAELGTGLPPAQAIRREAAIITVVLCKATGGQPRETCGQSGIAGLVAQVP